MIIILKIEDDDNYFKDWWIKIKDLPCIAGWKTPLKEQVGGSKGQGFEALSSK